jgi:cytochrome bd-type quinol oxidase subunit 1
LLVKDAVNPAQWINVSFVVFSCIYLLLAATLIVLLLRLARRPKPPQKWHELIEVEEESQEQSQMGEEVGAR